MSWYSDAGRFSNLQRWKDWEIEIIHSSNKGYYGGYGLINIGTHKVNDMFKLAGPCRSVVSQTTTNGCHITPHDVRQSLGGMGTIVGQHITATLQFDRNVTATLLHDQFSPLSMLMVALWNGMAAMDAWSGIRIGLGSTTTALHS